jgi:diguanylate cyclase (GGDEF)-like protein
MIKREDFLYDKSGISRPWQFEDQIKREVARSRRYGGSFSFVLVGVDDVDELTQRLGPNKMAILRERIVELVVRETRLTDTLGYHARGTIGALLPETPPEGAYLVAERIRAHVEKTLRHAVPKGEPVRVSIGVSSFRDDASFGAETLVSEAEEALRSAQGEGGNRCKVYLVA